MSEKKFLDFKDYLIKELNNTDWRTKAHFYKCDSFYDFFISCFEKIRYPDFNIYIDEKEQRNRLSGSGWWISKYDNLNEKEHNALLTIINKTSRDEAAEIQSMRGLSYMLFKDYEFKKKTSEDENKIVVNSNRPTGSEVNIPRLLINQITPKTFIILPLKNVIELEFDPHKFRYSFGIPNCVFPDYAGIGEIWFFNETGLEFSRINIIDLFNSNESNIEAIGHKFAKTNLKWLTVKFFQEDNFLFKVSVGEGAYAGRLRERWSGFSGKIDLKTNEWLNLEGDSSLESLK
jgi:hypothetical protein